MWSAALTVSVPFEFACGRSILTPELGVDFAYTSMEGFRESTAGNALGWRTGRDHTTSFRGLAGVRYEYRATDRVALTARARYGHEFADRQASFAARSADGVPFAFNTRGQDAGRASGLFGAGLKARVGARGEIGLNYDLHLSKDYVGHQVAATVGWGF